MQKITGLAVKAGVIAIALGLAGCGGGSGGSDSGPSAVTPTAQRSVQGTAAKGLIKGARVSVYAIDASGVRASTALATATTGADGTYSLQVPMANLNFVIEVSSAPGATMADEVSGADLPLPESLKLRSVVTLADNATEAYQGTVSPLTEMVARTAETADGKLPRQAVAQAKVSVRTLLGFDPETVKPINSNSAAAATASVDEKKQSLALAAISQMGSSVSADCGQSTAGERISCVVTKLAASVTSKDGQPAFDQARLAQFSEAIQSVVKNTTINRTGSTSVVGIPVLTPAPTTPGPTPTPTPPPAGETLSPVAATKALFSSLRTNLRSLDEGDALRATADSIKADLNGSIAPLGNATGSFAALAVNALDALERYGSGKDLNHRFVVYNGVLYGGFIAPPLERQWDGDGSCSITTMPLRMSCTVVTNGYLSTSGVVAGIHVRKFTTQTITFEPKAGSTSEFGYRTWFNLYSAPYVNGVITSPTPLPLGEAADGVMTFARSGDTLTALAIKGRMPGRMHDGAFKSDYEDWALDITRAEEAGGTSLYSFGGTFTSMLAGQSVGSIEIDDASFLRLEQQGGKVAVNAANELQVTLRGIVGSTTLSGTLRASGDQLDKSKTRRMPTQLSFDGSIKHQDATVFSGAITIERSGYANFDATAAESDANFVADTVELSGSLAVPKRPVLHLTVGATRTGVDSIDISAQYRDGTSVINASSTAKRGERHPLVKVSSADGVAFSFTDSSTPAQVTKDGAAVAQIDLAKGIISYSDGSTESLK